MARTLDRRQLVERSIIKKYRKELWNPFVLAVKRYELVRTFSVFFTIALSFLYIRIPLLP